MIDHTHTFDNGLTVYRRHLTANDLEHYQRCNLHEPEEEPIFLVMLDKLPPNGCYVNIGGAIGYYPLLAKLRRPDLRIHIYEPLERHRRYFLENSALNGFQTDDLQLHSEAVSEKSGKTEFVDKGYSSYLADYGRFYGPRRIWKRIWRRVLNRPLAPPNTPEIDTITLTQVVNRAGGCIDLLQIDVQGHEIGLLESSRSLLRSGSIRSFLIGTHGIKRHNVCERLLVGSHYHIDHSLANPTGQVDGILAASKTSR